MGNVKKQECHKKIMPELLVFKNKKLLLVKGIESERVFWWPPGAYWISEKVCDLQFEEPDQWIRRVLNSQIGVELKQAFLRSINIISANHAPVFVYQVDIKGDPMPNTCRGFVEIAFFESHNLPAVLGRDDKHGSWLHGLLEEFWAK